MPLLPSSTSQELGDRQHCSSRLLLTHVLSKVGAGGGNRTIRAYSFYVTYCKHTNARTAQPAVCPPPMYKIMYNKSDGVRPFNTVRRQARCPLEEFRNAPKLLSNGRRIQAQSHCFQVARGAPTVGLDCPELFPRRSGSPW